MIEGTFDVSVQDPSLALVGARDGINPGDGIMASPTGTEAVAGALKPGLPKRFQSVLHDRLRGTIDHGWDARCIKHLIQQELGILPGDETMWQSRCGASYRSRR